MDSDKLAELEHQLDFIRASIQEITDRLESQRDPSDYKLLLKVLKSEERLLSAGKSRHDLAGEIAQWKEELSSPTIDSAPPVTVVEEETSSYKVLSGRQYVELKVRSAEFRLTKLDGEIPQLEREYSRLYELALRLLPGFKPDEIPKKPAADKDAIEPAPAVEAPQPPPSIPTPSVAPEPPLESNPTQPPQSETEAIAASIPAPEQIDPGAPFPLSNRQIHEQYQDEYHQKTGNTLRQKDILKEAKYSDRTELARWLRQDPKYFNEDADKTFRELFTITKPHLK